MRIKYIGPDMVALEQNKIYEVLDIKHGTYKIKTELDEEYYVPREFFEIIDNKTEKPIQSTLIPSICPKCKTGKLESQCDGRVYICNNPSCKAGMWLLFEE